MGMQLVISIDEMGKVNVSGPLDNKLLCYGLLGLANEIIQKHQPNTSGIVKPTLVFPSS